MAATRGSPPPRGGSGCQRMDKNMRRSVRLLWGIQSTTKAWLLLAGAIAILPTHGVAVGDSAHFRRPTAAFVAGNTYSSFRRDAAFLWRRQKKNKQQHPTLQQRGGGGDLSGNVVTAASTTRGATLVLHDGESEATSNDGTAAKAAAPSATQESSVHLRLGSAAMTAKVEEDDGDDNECDDDEGGEGDTTDKKKETDKKKPTTAKLHTYHDPTTNFTYSGLSVPLHKFKVFVQHTLAVSIDAQAPFDPSYISSEEVKVDDDDARGRLRKLWRNGQLISDRTEFLAVYRSDLLVEERKKEESDDDGGASEEKDMAQKKKKRGDFSDLLGVYADRLVGIIQDEQEEERTAQQKEKMIEAMLVQNMTEATVMENQLTNGVAGGLIGYLKREYGETATDELMALSLLRLPQEEQFTVLQHFLDWFRSRFPYYYDKCSTCGASAKDDPAHSETNLDGTDGEYSDADTPDDDDDDEQDDGSNFIGYVYPSREELRGKAGRTEVYSCHRCGAFTRFPRYNSASTVMRNRRGRCGEYSMLLFRFLRAAGHEARWVVDWADHVWAEVLVGQPQRWIHLDPCEAALDKPLLYQDWGKQQTYIVAFHAPRQQALENNDTIAVYGEGAEGWLPRQQRERTPLIEDVTHMYTSDGIEKISKRRDEPLELVQSSLRETESELRTKLEHVHQEKQCQQ